MDAAASIINITALTGVLIEYLRAAMQAPSDRRKLLLEANTLVALLTSLKDYVTIEDQEGHLKWRRAVLELDMPDGPFAQYRKALQSLLKKLSPESRLGKATQTALWKLKKEDVNETLLRIERMKSLISIALEMDHTRLSEAILAQVSNVLKTTGKIADSVDKKAFQALLDQICPDDYSSVFQSNITEHTAGIGQNFIASAEFEQWAKSDDANRTLLCLGDPGVGKTVMATKAIQALQNENSALREAVLYVYCDFTRRRTRLYRRDSSPEARSKGVQTPGHFIASLLRQLAWANGAPSPFLKDVMERHERQKTRPEIWELEQAFVEIAQNFDRLFIIVDAMDEVDSLELDTFANHLQSICSGPSLRLLVTSRRHPQIEQIFEDSVRLEMRAHDDDTLQYLQSRARREFPPRVLRDQQALERILSALLISANGIPLIARLHMNALRGVRTPGGMLKAISRLTSNSDVYDETYQAAIERIAKQPGELPAMAMRVLRWIVCAKRYLYARELQCVLAMHEESDSLDEDFVPDMDDVFLACEGLVCTVSSPGSETVRLELVHTTARQYFERKLAQWAPDVSLDLTRTCLNVLSFKDWTPLPPSIVAYAWRYWGEHAKDVEELNEEEQFELLASIIRKFLKRDQSGSPLSRTVIVRKKREDLVTIQDGMTGYHLAARFGLVRLFETLWDPSDDLDAMLGPQNKTPLQQAISSESIDMIKAMLRLRCVDANCRNTTGVHPLEFAIHFQNPEIVQVLLESGMANPNDVDASGQPLVLVAAQLQQKRSLELLLAADRMETEAREEYGSALMAMASLGPAKWPRKGHSSEQVKNDTGIGAGDELSRDGLPLAANLKAHFRRAEKDGLDLSALNLAS